MSIQKTFPFTTPSNYTYDTDKVEIIGGVVKLKDQIPADATSGATYTSSINFNAWSDGTVTGTATGGAAVSGGELDLAHSDLRYVTYDADLNADSQQQGSIIIWVKPNYTGNALSQQYFICVGKSGGVNNQIAIHHFTSNLYFHIYSSTGVLIKQANLGVWAPTAGTEYKLQLNYDITNGLNELYVDDVLFGVADTSTGTRDANINQLRIGCNHAGALTSNFKVNKMMIFSTVQTPSASLDVPEAQYPLTNPTIEINETWRLEGLEGFTETSTKAGSDAIQYYLKQGTTKYYYSGGWVESDGTYSQSTSAADIETNKATFTTNIITFGCVLFLHSDSGDTTPEIDLLEIDYDYAGETPDTINTCIVYGYSKNLDNSVDDTQVSVKLNKNSTQYKTNTNLVSEDVITTPGVTDGYWEIELIETENMTTGSKYIFTVGGKEYIRDVPNEATKAFWDLT